MQREKEKEHAMQGGGFGLEDVERKMGFVEKHWYVTMVSLLAHITKMNFTKELGVRTEGSQDSE